MAVVPKVLLKTVPVAFYRKDVGMEKTIQEGGNEYRFTLISVEAFKQLIFLYSLNRKVEKKEVIKFFGLKTMKLFRRLEKIANYVVYVNNEAVSFFEDVLMEDKFVFLKRKELDSIVVSDNFYNYSSFEEYFFLSRVLLGIREVNGKQLLDYYKESIFVGKTVNNAYLKLLVRKKKILMALERLKSEGVIRDYSFSEKVGSIRRKRNFKFFDTIRLEY